MGLLQRIDWRLSWRLFRRESRSGELRLLWAALVVAVAAVCAVGFFADRVAAALERQAQQMMGGDLVLTADHPWPHDYRIEAGRLGLRLAETTIFPSMVLSRGRPQLAEIKAVSAAYPLRGQLEITDGDSGPAQATPAGPPAGEVWPDERLAAALDLQPGDPLQVGERRLIVAAVLSNEPDRGINLFSLAPRLMMAAQDLASTGLVQPGARLRYRLLLAGSPSAIAAYQAWAKPRLARGERLEDISNARPEVRSALDRAQRFLGLATLSTVVLAALAVALAARRYLQRHLDACALMRCFGLTHARLLALHALVFGWLAGVAWLVGAALGFVAHFVLAASLHRLYAVDLPWPGGGALLQGGAVAVVLLFGFAFPPLLQLARVPVLRVLRRELGVPQPGLLAAYGLGFLLIAGLIVAVARDLRLGMLAVAGFAAALLFFWGLAQALVRLIGRWRDRLPFAWRHGLAGIARHAGSSALQIVALGLGLLAILLLTVTRGQLLDAWQQALPPDAPNRFIINIQPDQRSALREALAGMGIEAELSPMVRARLLEIAGKPVSAASYGDDERAQRLVEREFNLSWRETLPAGNRITAGAWFTPAEAGQPLASVEAGLARTLGIRVGDELHFSIAGQETRLRVTSLRQLDWDSMRANFFVLTPPGVLDAAPASDITSFYLPDGQTAPLAALLAAFPNLTLIDTGALISAFRGILDQVAAAVSFVFGFTVLAGALVLQAAILSAFDERRYELAVMRALGARRGSLQRSLLLELALIGGLAGLLAALGAWSLGALLARQAFELELALSPGWLLLASLGGALLAQVIGWVAVRRLLSTPPLLALRAGA